MTSLVQEENESSNTDFPAGMRPLESQVAGHLFDETKYTIGMLRSLDGRVLKPVTKPLLGKREISFYENLRVSKDPLMTQLRSYVPRYYGTTELQIFGRRWTFLALKDITEGMAEPCVMDIKIGRRTWDPLATPQKRATEELKYAQSKGTYGFCITGFQVYCPSTGQLRKFGKHYGQTLDADGVVEALKTFLNISPERPPCRHLIVKLLSFLWKILLYFRTQRAFRFYSSSLLVAYDASRLPGNERTGRAYRHHVVAHNHQVYTDPTWRPRPSRPLKRSLSLSSELELAEGMSLNSFGPEPRDDIVGGLCRARSYLNNVEHAARSGEAGRRAGKDNWVRINMIDFTHVFPAEDPGKLDLNYLEGIENLIKLLEILLKGRTV